jgi:hypothetical protein
VHQLARTTSRRDEVEEPPAARRLVIQAQDPPRQHVSATEVVQQPAVETKLSQAPLNGFEIEYGHHASRHHRK